LSLFYVLLRRKGLKNSEEDQTKWEDKTVP
jgi:hypothetical protein